MVGKECTWEKELQATNVKMQGLEIILKAFKTIIEWENIAIENKVESTFYEQLILKLPKDVQSALKDAQMEMKK